MQCSEHPAQRSSPPPLGNPTPAPTAATASGSTHHLDDAEHTAPPVMISLACSLAAVTDSAMKQWFSAAPCRFFVHRRLASLTRARSRVGCGDWGAQAGGTRGALSRGHLASAARARRGGAVRAARALRRVQPQACAGTLHDLRNPNPNGTGRTEVEHAGHSPLTTNARNPYRQRAYTGVHPVQFSVLLAMKTPGSLHGEYRAGGILCTRPARLPHPWGGTS